MELYMRGIFLCLLFVILSITSSTSTEDVPPSVWETLSPGLRRLYPHLSTLDSVPHRLLDLEKIPSELNVNTESNPDDDEASSDMSTAAEADRFSSPGQYRFNPDLSLFEYRLLSRFLRDMRAKQNIKQFTNSEVNEESHVNSSTTSPDHHVSSQLPPIPHKNNPSTSHNGLRSRLRRRKTNRPAANFPAMPNVNTSTINKTFGCHPVSIERTFSALGCDDVRQQVPICSGNCLSSTLFATNYASEASRVSCSYCSPSHQTTRSISMVCGGVIQEREITIAVSCQCKQLDPFTL